MESFSIGLIIVCVIGYFIPSLIAACRNYRAGTILLINLFLGWTAVIWIVIFFLATFGKPEVEKK